MYSPYDTYTEDLTKTRNRIEQRTVHVFNTLDFSHRSKWNLVKRVICVDRYCEVFDTKKNVWVDRSEISFYISTTKSSAETFCKLIRGHWGIENRNHYVRDVALQEDKSRIRVNPGIFAILRSFALNIMRINNVKNISAEIYENALL